MSTDDNEDRERAPRERHANRTGPAQRRASERAGASEGQSPDSIEEIRRMYFRTTPKTIQRDFERAIDLLKALKDDEARGKAAVYMEGLNELRKEWRRGR
jgi:hypothetical protein